MLVPLLQALENRTLDSKREMDIMNALDEMKSLKSRQEKVDSEALLAALQRSADDDWAALAAEDEAAVRAMLQQQRTHVKRVEDDSGAASQSMPSAAAGACHLLTILTVSLQTHLPWLLHVLKH